LNGLNDLNGLNKFLFQGEPMADSKILTTNIDETTGIAWLTLNRPEKKMP
jgi:hypothetical protein